MQEEISNLIFIALIAAMVFLVKQHLVKFMGFYIVRKDYQRLNIAPAQHNQENFNNSESSPKQYSPSKDNEAIKNKESKLQCMIQMFKKNLVQNLYQYHPLYSVTLQKIRTKMNIIKLPVTISVSILMILLFSFVTLAFTLTNIRQSYCLDKRFYANNAYVCLMKTQDNNSFSLDSQVGLAIAITIFVIAVSITGVYFFSRNYIKFMNKCTSISSQDESELLDEQQYKTRRAISDKFHNPTLQNMLNDDSDFTRRSIKGNNQMMSNFMDGSNKDLFQINEDDEEQPYSPSKNNISKGSILGENRNILNTQNSIKKSQSPNMKPVLSKMSESDQDQEITDPPQFCSNKKNRENDENRPHSQVSKTKQIRHKKQNQSTSAFSDTTTIDGGHSLNQGNLSVMKHLEGIQEEEFEKEGTYTNQRLKEAGFLGDKTENDSSLMRLQSKEDLKEDDSSRLNILTRDPTSKSHIQREPQSSSYQWIGLVSALLILMLFIMGILFDLYAIFNMTIEGISSALTLFGLSIVLDFFILRFVVLIGYTMVQTFKQRNDSKGFEHKKSKMIQEETIYLLSQIYESYEIQMIPQSQELNTQMLIDENVSDCDNSGRNSQGQRIIKISENARSQQPQKRRQFGEIVLIESTFFYHQKEMQINRPRQTQDVPEQVNIGELAQRSNKKKKPTQKGEKVSISKSLAFNAEDAEMKKSHKEKGNEQKEDSNYDIEEIPMYSSRNRSSNKNNDKIKKQDLEEERSFILPPINAQQQFETPRDSERARAKSKLNGIGITQQVIQFNDLRESEKKSKGFLRDLLGLSGSKGVSPNKNDYQSLKRYLEDDKENLSQFDEITIKKIESKSTKHMKSRSNKKDLEGDQTMANYTPQYTSNNKGSLMANQINSKSSKADLRKSANLHGGFSDLRNVNICHDLERGKIYHQKSNIKSHQKSIFDDQTRKSMISNSGLKRSIHSPSVIKETLDQRLSQMKMQLNVSPFNENKQSIVKAEKSLLDHLPFVNPFSPTKGLESTNKNNDFQFFIQPHFDQNSKAQTKHLVSNLVLQEQPFQSIDANGAKVLTTRVGNRTIEDSIDANVRRVLKGVRGGNKEEESKDEDDTQRVIDSDEFNTEEDKSQTLFNMQRIEVTQKIIQEIEEDKNEEYQDEVIIVQQQELQMPDNSYYEDTNRSKIFEDSDQSTFRMINFGGSKRSNSNTNSKNHTANIDFYSQATDNKSKFASKPKASDKKKGNTQQLGALATNLILAKHSNKDSVQIMESRESSHENNDSCSNDQQEELDISKDNMGIVTNLMNQLNQEDLKAAEDDTEDLDFKFCKRQPTRGTQRSSLAHRNNTKQQIFASFESAKSKTDKEQTMSSQEGAHIAPSGRPQIKKKKENNEYLLLRIEEQKRKLKSFLKLAKQLHSQKDEVKIREMLAIIKQTKKPLPISQINELKQLEIMASPYNQSLIAMIKDEYDKQKNSAKPPSASGKARNVRSQQRSELRTGAAIKQLNNIYGQVPNQSFGIQRNSKSREATTRDGSEIGLGRKKSNKKIADMKQKMKSTRVHQSHESFDESSEIGSKARKMKQSKQPIILSRGGDTSSMSQLGMPTSEEEDYNTSSFRNPGKGNFIEVQDDSNDEFNNLQ